MSELEQHKALIKEITDRANDKYYDTKLIANVVYWILEQMADRKTEPQTTSTPYKIDTSSICKIGPQTDCDHKCVQTEVGCESTDCPYIEYPCDVCDLNTDCPWK